MSDLLVDRYEIGPTATFGRLFRTAAGFFCYTLENSEKRIPPGRYQVVLTPSGRAAAGTLWSPRADHQLPLLLDVPGRTAIRIHAANVPEELEGCLAVGMGRTATSLTESRHALEALMLTDLASPTWIALKDGGA